MAATLRRLQFEGPFGVVSLHAYRARRHKLLVLERQQLWADEHPLYLEALRQTEERFPGLRVKTVNPFPVLRRPADALV